MTWDGVAVRLAASSEEAGGGPRFYDTGGGVYFEVTSPGGGEDAAALHRSIRITVPRGAAGAASLSLDLNGNFGDATLDGSKVPPKGAVALPPGTTTALVDLHDVAGKSWGWISGPTRR